VACRFDGEEFALILSGASSEDAVARGELLREDLKHLSVQHAGQTRRISFSIGISAFPGHGTTAEELVRAADEALYCAREDGRDRVVLASAQGSVKAR
jgi:diguanylate cyclase (GGDEF)-like protein